MPNLKLLVKLLLKKTASKMSVKLTPVFRLWSNSAAKKSCFEIIFPDFNVFQFRVDKNLNSQRDHDCVGNH
jgi:hypothetical protein